MLKHKKMPPERDTKTTHRVEKQPVVSQISSDSDFINNLTDDSLERIFKCLSLPERLAVESVCKRWKSASQFAWGDVKQLDLISELSPSFRLNKFGLFTDHNEYITKLIERCGHYLEKLKIGNPCSTKILPFIGQRCYNLTCLEMDFCYYDKTSFNVFLQLQKLKCLRIWGVKKNFPEELLLSVPSESLTEIYLSARVMCDLDEGLYAHLPPVVPKVITSIKNLKILTLEDFELKSDMIEAIRDKKDLIHLALKNCLVRQRIDDIQDFTNLEHLELHLAYGSAPQLSDHVLEQMTNKCKNLKYLGVTGWDWFTDVESSHLEQFPKLEELVLNSARSITDQWLANLHNLRRLECKNCKCVTDNGIIPLMKSAKNLEYLNVTGTQVSKMLFVEAAEVTKKRMYGHKLELVVSEGLIDRQDGNVDISPALVIEPGDLSFEKIALIFYFFWLPLFIPVSFQRCLQLFVAIKTMNSNYVNDTTGRIMKFWFFPIAFFLFCNGTFGDWFFVPEDERENVHSTMSILLSSDRHQAWDLLLYLYDNAMHMIRGHVIGEFIINITRKPYVALAVHLCYCSCFAPSAMMYQIFLVIFLTCFII